MQNEVPQEGVSKKERSHLVGQLEEQVKAATDMLLKTDFPACFSLCERIIAASISNAELSGDNTESLNSIKEAAVIVGIQALAEQGCWQNVIPFVEQAYHQIGACPAKVIHMCILLHAHIREYMLCHSLVNTWLDANSHRSSPDAAVTVRLYVQNVLRPLGAFNLIPQVVDSCPALSSTEREALLSPHSTPPKTTYERQNDPSEPCNNLPSSDAEPTAGKTRTAKSQDSGILASYVDLARQLLRKAARKGWCRQACRATKCLLFLSIALLAIVSIQNDVVSNFSRTMVIWKKAIEMWTSFWKHAR
ncbi:hypothetical protein C0Q70_15844 [Pomacea canaliculata]|uniref:Peroxisome assembly protein 26 n=1 Tax=Pomacea canaliculata TaxID=400727 RepID=A0A2T7NW17_POMCA|nr:peroxisome assembly protein 26-like isoform X3 [Pomacea canaliculata]PVD25344.1 hypothetical protein C0Q70_15844 [Pomacea canaliculata]